MKKNLYNWLPVAGYFCLISLLSSFASLRVTSGVDKLWHLFEYIPLGFLCARGLLLTFDGQRRTLIWAAALGAAGLGIVDELHQHFVPGRVASWQDAAADALGALLGAWLFVRLGGALYRRHKLYPRVRKCRGGL